MEETPNAVKGKKGKGEWGGGISLPSGLRSWRA